VIAHCYVNATNVTLCSDKTAFNRECVTRLEDWIDEYQQQLPLLTNFILPVCFQTDMHFLSNGNVPVMDLASCGGSEVA